MSIHYARTAISSICLAGLVSLLADASTADATDEPIRVTHSISIHNGDWIPLSAEDMRRAAGDTALSRLTDAGRLRLIDRAPARGGRATPDQSGSLALEINLIGPAETAKLTITLDVVGSPTLVSTASISVRALDHAGIYGALEHVGERAAGRLAAKLDLLQNARRAGARDATPSHDDPARRRRYDQAQIAKRAGRYEEARLSFETVVESAVDADDPLRALAEDELRFGLPLFEAQQALNQLGRLSRPGQQQKREEALARAENLYRQIQAENPSNVERVTQAQGALDNLIVMRGALANAMRASLRSQIYGLRIAMLEHTMIEGSCPDKQRVDDLASNMRARVVLDQITIESKRARRYTFSEPDSRSQIELRCDDFGIDVVESEGRSSRYPAARH